MSSLPVAMSVIVQDSKILLIKRIRGDYAGLWAIPGGKIEENEHVSDAAVREVLEESGIKTEFKKHLGFVSEHLMEDGNIIRHFLLHVCELVPKSAEITNGKEGRLEWFDLGNIEHLKNEIIPSDFLVIEKMIKAKEKNYYNCIIEKSGNEHILRKFE